jgi:hypothetical protein
MKTNFLNKPLRYINANPLKEKFRKRKIPLWHLRNYTGIPESKLSRFFNGIDPMPAYLEEQLYELLFILDGGDSEKWRVFKMHLLKAQEKMLDDEVTATEKKCELKSEEKTNESNATD